MHLLLSCVLEYGAALDLTDVLAMLKYVVSLFMCVSGLCQSGSECRNWYWGFLCTGQQPEL